MPPSEPMCEATVGDYSGTLSPTQASNAAMITAVAMQRGLPARAATIGVATAAQESSLRNIDYGDRDSIGLFQQRPSQGWGTVSEIMDPIYSTNAFYDALITVDNYKTLPVTEAAQSVQRSAFPDAYAKREPMARAFASALTGHSPARMTCTVEPPTVVGRTSDLVTRLKRDYGADNVVWARGEHPSQMVVVNTSVMSEKLGVSPQHMTWSVGHWSIANAGEFPILKVEVMDENAHYLWDRAEPRWQTSATANSEKATHMIVITMHAAP